MRAVPHCQNGLSVELVQNMDAKIVENSQNVQIVGLVSVKIASTNVNAVMKPPWIELHPCSRSNSP